MTEEAEKPLREIEAEEAIFAEESTEGRPEAEGRSNPGAGKEPGSMPVALIGALLLAVLALLAAGGLAYVGMDKHKQVAAQLDAMGQQAGEQRNGVTGLSERLEGLSGGLAEQSGLLQQQGQRVEGLLTRLEAERQQYEKGRQETLQALNSLQKRMGRSTSRWMAAEAEYLIRVANHRLQLEADASTALSALQAADERLRDTADPLWTPVREVLAEDIAGLQSLAPPDYAGLSARIAGLARQVDKLKVKTLLLNQPLSSDGKAVGKGFDWEKMLTDGWQGFRSLMVVRRHDQPVAAMLPPEQRFFLGQNLRLQLESARLALLRRDQQLYDGAIRSANAWLKEFFEQKDPGTAAIQRELQQLADVKVRMPMPDVSGALAVLRQRVEQSREGGDRGAETPMPGGEP
jgi:uroporphyrin-3 C-methyltransferase